MGVYRIFFLSAFDFVSVVRHKRKPVRTEKGPRHIFVTRASRFGALLARVMRLLQTDPAPVTIHGLGAAIARACDLALAVQESAGGHVTLACKTDTVLVYDDFQPIVSVCCRVFIGCLVLMSLAPRLLN